MIENNVERIQSLLSWKWKTFQSIAKIYIEANRHAFKLVTKSATGVNSLLTTPFSYILANL